VLGHLADALGAGLAVDVPRLLAAAQLAQPQTASIAAGAHHCFHRHCGPYRAGWHVRKHGQQCAAAVMKGAVLCAQQSAG
jgi:hypothetical protein